MAKKIEMTEEDRAHNVAFQIKNLLGQLQENTKPQIDNAASLIEKGTQGLSRDALIKALGGDEEAKEYLDALVAISKAL